MLLVGVSIIFFVDAIGFANIFAIHFNIMFYLIKIIIWVEHKIYNHYRHFCLLP